MSTTEGATSARHPLTELPRLAINQAPPLLPANLAELDLPLREALTREGADWAMDDLLALGAEAGSVEAAEHAWRAEHNEPILLTHDRYGRRIDEVQLDPSWHWLLGGAINRGLAASPWREPVPGAHVARAAKFMTWGTVNAGVWNSRPLHNVRLPSSPSVTATIGARYRFAIAASACPGASCPVRAVGNCCAAMITSMFASRSSMPSRTFSTSTMVGMRAARASRAAAVAATVS